MRLPRLPIALLLASFALPALATPPPCNGGTVYEDRNGNGERDPGEPGAAGVKVSDGHALVLTDERGFYLLPTRDGRTTFVVKPPGFRFAQRGDGLPDFWRHVRREPGPVLKYGGIPTEAGHCRDFALIPEARTTSSVDLDVLLFADPQVKSSIDVGYYARDIVDSVLASPRHGSARLGLSLGDIVHDDLSLYPAISRETARLQRPWLHVAGNHDLDFDAIRDEDSLLSFRNTYGPDTFAWEEPEATFVVLDDVVYLPRQKPEYVGGLREEQFAFLEAYLPTLPRERLLVIAAHIPFFDTGAGRETFRRRDRERLFALLRGFPNVLLLSGHSHTQSHHFHGPDSGWNGAGPLHEYNVGAASGAFWSGVKDARGVPDTTMSDGTPNGFATLHVSANGAYRLEWHPAAEQGRQIALHAPKVLRRGAWPGQAVTANVFMGHAGTTVEYRIDGGAWRPMQRIEQPDPRVLAENRRDDEADTLRAYDRAPEATPSRHLWRATLPTDLAVGEHRVEVRAAGLRGEGSVDVAEVRYRLVE